MEIIIGKTSGFCKGVEHTVREASKILEKEKVYCLGEIVHNERVVTDLKNLGMITINNISDAKNNSKVIVRAHGEVKETYEIAFAETIVSKTFTIEFTESMTVPFFAKSNPSWQLFIVKTAFSKRMRQIEFEIFRLELTALLLSISKSFEILHFEISSVEPLRVNEPFRLKIICASPSFRISKFDSRT